MQRKATPIIYSITPFFFLEWAINKLTRSQTSLHLAYRQSIIPWTISSLFWTEKFMKLVSTMMWNGGPNWELYAKNRADETWGLENFVVTTGSSVSQLHLHAANTPFFFLLLTFFGFLLVGFSEGIIKKVQTYLRWFQQPCRVAREITCRARYFRTFWNP